MFFWDHIRVIFNDHIFYYTLFYLMMRFNLLCMLIFRLGKCWILQSIQSIIIIRGVRFLVGLELVKLIMLDVKIRMIGWLFDELLVLNILMVPKLSEVSRTALEPAGTKNSQKSIAQVTHRFLLSLSLELYISE